MKYLVSGVNPKPLCVFKNEGGGTQVCKLYMDVPPKWVVFSQEILRHGFTFQRKNP